MDKGLYFYSNFCSGCQAAKITINELISEGYKIDLIDVKKSKELVQEYKIKAVPVLVILRDGKEIERFVGSDKMDPDAVKKVFKKTNSNNDDYKVW